MKQKLVLILTALLLCTSLAPSVLAAEEPVIPAETPDTVTDSDSTTVSDDSIDIPTPSVEDMVTDGAEISSADDSTATTGGTEDVAVPDSFDYTGSVISFTTPDVISGTFDMDCGDTGFTQLHNAFDSVCIFGTVEKDGTSYPLTLSVTWDFSTVDAETPGSYTAMGTISIPEGAVLAAGLENTLSISVQVTAPALPVLPKKITLTSFDEPDRTDAVAFPVGTTQEDLSKWFADSVAGFIGYDADGNPYDLISGAWSLDSVDTVTAGVYFAYASPDRGTEYTLADGVSLPRQLCAVSIQVPGTPDINCCVSGRGFLHFPWVLSAAQEEQLEEFAVWLRQDGGEWTSLCEGYLFVSDGLQLSQRIFTNGSTYELKVSYPGGQTGVLTFQYDGALSILDYSGGDRDGGDGNGGGSGSGTQPAPTTPQTPSDSHEDDHSDRSDNMPAPGDSSSESNGKSQDSGSTPGELQKSDEEQDSPLGETKAPPTAPKTPSDLEVNANQNSDDTSPTYAPVTEKPLTLTPAVEAESSVPVCSDTHLSLPELQAPAAASEFYSPTQTLISGLRLRDLCKDEESVVFDCGDLTVSIPSKLLLALNLSDTDTLTVTLTQPENNQILLAVEASGKAVTELTGAVLRLRYVPQSERTEITIQNEDGEPITDASYDGELLRFAADAPGTYTISEQLSTQETQKDVSPLLPVSGGLLLAAGGITFWGRRLHG